MINLNVNPSSAGGGPVKNQQFPLFVKLLDSLKIGLSKRSNGTTDADGTLYPTNFPNEQYTGYIQNQINNLIPSSGTNPADMGLGLDNGAYNNNQTKYKVAEAFVNKWKRFKYAKILGALIAGGQSPSLGISGATVNDYGDIVDLGSNKFVMFFSQSSGTVGSYAVVGTVTPSTGAITWGTPVIFSTTQSSIYRTYFKAVLINTDKVAFVYRYQNATDGVYIRVLTVSGTTITMGTQVTANATGHDWGYGIVKMDTDKYLASYARYNGGYRQYLRAGTVSGTTITQGSETNDSNDMNNTKLYRITTDKALLIYHGNNTGNNYYNYCEIITLSGTTITQNSQVEVQASSPFASSRFEAVQFTTDKWIFYHGENSSINYVNAQVFDTSGTSIVRIKEAKLVASNIQPHRAYLRSYSGGVAVVDVYGPYGTATVTVDSSYNISQVYGSGITVAVPISSEYDILFGQVGTAMLATHKQNPTLNTAKYSYSGTVTVELYNDAAIIGSSTALGMALGTTLIQADVAVNNEKAYLGIKNVSGASVWLNLVEVLMEAS